MPTKSSTKRSGKGPEAQAPPDATGGSLDAYRKKRDPAATNEPFAAERIASGKETHTGSFVVHLHDARRRHWDVRLQIGGSLHSFAVPRGPSLDPREKRLAVETEDHPIEYLEFEEIIPEGNYGAGAMIAWDLGRVQFLEPAEEGLRKGKLDFVLYGYKLGGRFALVRTGDRAGRSKEEKNHWLFFKKADAFSSETRDILVDAPESVLSGLTVEQLASREEIANALEREAERMGAPAGDVQARKLVPMLCSTDGARLDDPKRLYELKLDGVRLLADKRGTDVSLVYRSQRIMTASYPEVARAMRALPLERVVLDGEVVAFDDQGRPSFQRLGRRMHLTRPLDVAHAAGEVPVVYVAFDVLQVEGRDVRKLPLSARKELLAKIAPRRGIIRLLEHLEGDGKPLSDLCEAMGLEGLVAKTLASPYRAGPERSADWVKIKRPRAEDFVVTGWVEGNGGRKSFGAIEVSTYQDGELRLRSRVGSGFDGSMIQKITGLLAPLEVAGATSVGEPIRGSGRWRGAGGKRHHTKPEIVVSVTFSGWTEDAGLRHPVFHGLRQDIPPEACTAAPPASGDGEERDALPEPPAAAPISAKPEAPAGEREGRRTKVKLSNLNKVFWPDEGYTKGELIEYYRAIAPAMMPFLRDRPIVLVRYPDGIKGKSFYQWNVPEGTPSWMRTLHLLDDEGNSRKHTFIVDDVDGLTHIANMGCIPIHVLPYRSASVTECDYFVVDFDIGPRSFSDAVTLAFSLREILTDLGLLGFPKTSGQSGFHVLVPLGPGISFDVAKVLCDLVGRVLQARHPELATMGRRIEGRGDRVFVDVGQTGRSRTIVAPYSVRAHPGATVSMPLRWEDVHRALDPREFSMFTAPLRVAERGAAFEGFFDARPDVAAVVEKLGQKLGVEG